MNPIFLYQGGGAINLSVLNMLKLIKQSLNAFKCVLGTHRVPTDTNEVYGYM